VDDDPGDAGALLDSPSSHAYTRLLSRERSRGGGVRMILGMLFCLSCAAAASGAASVPAEDLF
jgi:hypothetical protein